MCEKSFIEKCLSDEANFLELDTYIEYWYAHDTHASLREFLGMTQEEYRKWANAKNAMFAGILDHRRQNSKIENSFQPRIISTLEKYLTGHDWIRVARKKKNIHVYRKEDESGRFQIIIPIDNTLSDYTIALYNAVETISSLKDKSIEDFLKQITRNS